MKPPKKKFDWSQLPAPVARDSAGAERAHRMAQGASRQRTMSAATPVVRRNIDRAPEPIKPEYNDPYRQPTLAHMADKIAEGAMWVPGAQLPAAAWQTARAVQQGDPLKGLLAAPMALIHAPNVSPALEALSAGQVERAALARMVTTGERRGAVSRARRWAAEKLDPSVAADRRALVTDEMTGLGNRRAFEDARPRIDADPAMSWITLDAQRLKAVNTQYGQLGGDALLRRSGDAVHAALKDIPGARGFHVSGDEFAIAVPKGMEQTVMERASSARIPVHADGRLGSAGLVGHVGDTYAAADKGLQGAKAAAKKAEPLTPVLDFLKKVKATGPDLAGEGGFAKIGRTRGVKFDAPHPAYGISAEGKNVPVPERFQHLKQQVPPPPSAIPQLPLTRKQPLTAKSTRETSDLLDRVYNNFKKAEKQGAIERGVQAGAPEWWRADATRQRFYNELGPDKGEAAFREWAKQFAGTSAMSDASSNMARSMFLFPQLEHPSGHTLSVFRKEGLNPTLPKGIGTIAGQTQGKVMADILDPAVSNPWALGDRAKMQSMYENTTGNWRPSTHDRHMGRTGLNDMEFPSSIGGNQYDPFETATNLRANELMKRGDLPVAPGKAPDAPYQASMWVGNGEKTGVLSDPRNVDQLFSDQMAEYARAHGISESEFMRRFARRDPALFEGMTDLTTVRAVPAHKAQGRLPGF
jgi:GGDEF domain-containing protein